jgi:ubiquinol-cytochrome c reductase iron-sulfur subunit
LQAAADTLALSSLEVDLTGIEEGSTITVKWRGKPVFIQHRSAEQIATAAGVPLSDLKDPQKDADRVVDPKVRALSAGDCSLTVECIAAIGNPWVPGQHARAGFMISPLDVALLPC